MKKKAFACVIGGVILATLYQLGFFRFNYPSPGRYPVRGIDVELPNLLTQTDKEIVIPVSVQGVAGKDVISYEVDLRYDPSVIQPIIDAADAKCLTDRIVAERQAMVENETGGAVKVNLFPAGQLGGEREIAEAVKLGSVQVGMLSGPFSGFCKEVFRELPMEFAVEAQKLLGVSLEGSVG